MNTDKEKDGIVFGAIANFLGQPQGGCVTKPRVGPLFPNTLEQRSASRRATTQTRNPPLDQKERGYPGENASWNLSLPQRGCGMRERNPFSMLPIDRCYPARPQA